MSERPPGSLGQARQAYRTLELANQNARGLLRFGRPEQHGAIIEELLEGLEAAQVALAAILAELGARGEEPLDADSATAPIALHARSATV
jgi:hypothetical protein